MAVTYGFYDSLAGDRKYNADQLSRMFEGIITEGVFQSVGGALIVSAGTGMTVNVASGRAWFRNTWTLNDSVLPITLDASEPALNRIDRIILEVNKDLGVRANSIKSVKGTPASSPVAPTLVDTATVKQYALADIYVGLGVTSITAGNITNKVGTTGTPFITGVVSSMDIATLLAQYEAQFNAWFTDLQNELDSNQAANLQNQINSLESQNDYGWISVSDTWGFSTANSIVIPSDGTTKYKKGWGIRFKQGGAYKYMYITGVSSTLLTVKGGTDYSVTNAPITDISYSLDPNNAFGFPSVFNYNARLSGTGGSAGTYAETSVTQKFRISGGLVFVMVTKSISNKGSWSGNVQVDLPVACLNDGQPKYISGASVIASSGLAPRAIGSLYDGAALISFQKQIAAAFLAWTDIVNLDWIILDIFYPF